MLNSSVCNQKKQQQAITPVDNASPHQTISSSTSSATEEATVNTTPPGATSASPTESSPLAPKESNDAASPGEKRKESEDAEPDATASSSSEPNKRIKVSKTIDCEVALKVLRGINFLDTRFLNSGKVNAWALEPDHPDSIRIHQYVENSQDPRTPIKILSILRIITAADKLKDGAPEDFNNHPNASEMCRKMLWHGTPTCNVSSILEDGLTVPFPDKGIKFYDRVAQSRYDCSPSFFNSGKYLFLCDVLLARKDDWDETDEEAVSLTSTVGDIKCQTHKFPGVTIPDKEFNVDVNGCVWPVGRNIRNMDAGPWNRRYCYCYSGYYVCNKFVVYNSAQIHPKFLLQVEC